MTNSEIHREFSGTNFLTPTILDYGQRQEYVYELSEGDGIFGGKIFGVTVRNIKTKQDEHDMSEMFHSLNAAYRYIDSSFNESMKEIT